jgi:hypothetical protein
MAQRVDGHPPSDYSGKMSLREALIMMPNDECRMEKTTVRLRSLVIVIRASFVIRPLSFIISLASLPIGNFAIATG